MLTGKALSGSILLTSSSTGCTRDLKMLTELKNSFLPFLGLLVMKYVLVCVREYSSVDEWFFIKLIVAIKMDLAQTHTLLKRSSRDKRLAGSLSRTAVL